MTKLKLNDFDESKIVTICNLYTNTKSSIKELAIQFNTNENTITRLFNKAIIYELIPYDTIILIRDNMIAEIGCKRNLTRQFQNLIIAASERTNALQKIKELQVDMQIIEDDFGDYPHTMTREDLNEFIKQYQGIIRAVEALI